MKLPIALGLAWPDRLPGAARSVDWTVASSWTFEPLDDEAFPAVRLARRAGQLGGTAPAVFNAANEECVDAFHEGRIAFLDILDVVEAVLEEHTRGGVTAADVGSTLVATAELDVPTVLAADQWARHRARERNEQLV
jgi:1-deoxy-D-xylulose-5-phosphate reductoisomerase